jgi:signal transduction histidine kinase
MAASAADRAGLALETRVPDSIHGLSSDVEHAIYRIAAEAVANVVRHAGARCLTVSLEDTARFVQLLVADDGRGFDATRVPDEGHFGLYGMRERAHMISAELEVRSASGTGTAVRLMIAAEDRESK